MGQTLERKPFDGNDQIFNPRLEFKEQPCPTISAGSFAKIQTANVKIKSTTPFSFPLNWTIAIHAATAVGSMNWKVI